MSHLVPIERLRRVCEPQTLNFSTTEELGKTKAILGQDRAARSSQFGLDIQALGFNVYVAGLPGTGRTTMVKRFLEDVAKDKRIPSDWCYVNNFHDSSRPKALRLPAKRAGRFQEEVEKETPFVETMLLPGAVPFYPYGPGEYLVWPYVFPEPGFVLAEKEHVPPGELTVRRGVRVRATDGDIGQFVVLLSKRVAADSP